MKITTIQLYEDTKRKLNQIKEYPSESYDSVLKRVLDTKEIPSMEEMFKRGDEIVEGKKYTTNQIIKMSHELRNRR
ncbi:hypothetical protein HYX00_06390 [Candidatus Woesearchaeota archaeon]|nr:hypothetical protein [Candidatus Woesearchaeota archaeon]